MKEEKDINSENSVTSTISGNCKYDLDLLVAYKRSNLSKTVQSILEQYVPILLSKEINRKLKTSTTEE